jgi:hypothetical protein
MLDQSHVSTGPPNVFRREGEYWVIGFDDDLFQLRDVKGLRYLAVLLGNPGREVLAFHLVARPEAEPVLPRRTPAASGLRIFDPHASDPFIDEQARAAYERRLEELREAVEESQASGDLERASRSRDEMEVLAHELGRAIGLGGGIRETASPAEKARQSATKAIRSAVGRIAAHSPALARHLGSTVRTGVYCIYDPDPRVPVTWRL